MQVPPLLARALAVSAVALLLLVPVGMIAGKVGERRARAQQVVAQFASETTGPQVVAGPLLVLTCEETFGEERVVKRRGSEETVEEEKTRPCPSAFFTPQTLAVSATMPVETRYRGIYPVHLYHASIRLSGRFEWPGPAPWNGINPRAWKKAYVVVQVSDTRGIKSVASTISPEGIAASDAHLDGRFAIQHDLGEYSSSSKAGNVAFDYQLQLDGTSTLHIAPVGDSSDIGVRSDWPHPSFVGSGSPDERHIEAGGFEARWRTTRLATGGRPFWEPLARKDGLRSPAGAVCVALFEPVNVYSLAYRATEYAFLFILFTFATLALLEALAGVRVHPVQYALVGSAIAVFFLLLLAISEHAPFSFAYGSAAAACAALIAVYLRHPLRSAPRAAGFGALVAALYGLLYVVLVREDDALLLGSLLVFALLATVMIGTRRLDWNEMARRVSRGAPAATP